MPAVRISAFRLPLCSVLATAWLWAAPAAGTACTPEEYMTAEERASGQYDTTPAPWETGGAPHDHGVASTGAAPTGHSGGAPRTRPQSTPSPSATAPAAPERQPAREPAVPRRAGHTGDGAGHTPGGAGHTHATTTGAGHSHATRAVASRPNAGRRRHGARVERPRSGTSSAAAKAARAASSGTRSARVSAAGLAALAATGTADAAAAARVPAELLLALALLLTGGLAAGALARRRSPRAAPDATPAPDAIEAELQEIVAEARAREALGTAERAELAHPRVRR